MTAGLDLRHEGIEANLAADRKNCECGMTYGDLVREAIECMPRGEELTADSIRNMIATNAEPHHPNVLPSVFGTLAAAGVIVRVGEVNAARRSRHGSRNAVWRRS